MEEKLDCFIKSVEDKLANLDSRITRIDFNANQRGLSASSAPFAPYSAEPSDSHGDHVASSLATPGATGTSQDLQGDFQALKDSLSRVKLPADLRINESRQGIQRKDQPVFSVLSKCSRYNETLVKLLSTIEPESRISQETIEQLFLIASAQVRFLQDEYAALVVSSQFDNNTSRLFKALQKNTSGLNPASLETLRSAATIAASSRPSTSSRPGGQSFRGRDRGSYGNNGQRSDIFQNFSQRQFPRRPATARDAPPSHDDE